MKKLIGIFLLIIAFTGCTRERYEAQGTLTGVDGTMCACCGGVILVLDGDPTQYRIDSFGKLPPDLNQQMADLDFPKRIFFDYGTQFTCGNITHLKINQFTIRD